MALWDYVVPSPKPDWWDASVLNDLKSLQVEIRRQLSQSVYSKEHAELRLQLAEVEKRLAELQGGE